MYMTFFPVATYIETLDSMRVISNRKDIQVNSGSIPQCSVSEECGVFNERLLPSNCRRQPRAVEIVS